MDKHLPDLGCQEVNITVSHTVPKNDGRLTGKAGVKEREMTFLNKMSLQI